MRGRKTDGDDERLPVISIVGLGPMGVRIGHALQAVKTRYTLLGHDVDAARVRAALGAGAVDRGTWSLAEAAAEADLLFLCEPVDAVCATLAQVAPHVRPGTLITDTAPLKAPVLAAAAQWVPEGVAFIGGHPIVRWPTDGDARPDADARTPAVGDGGGSVAAPPAPDAGSAAAVARSPAAAPPHRGAPPAHDGLRGLTYCLCPAPQADETAMRVLASLVDGVGAIAYFIDPLEHDALVAGTHVLPAVLGAAVLRVLDRSPSAVDLRRLIGVDLQAMLEAAADADARADVAAALTGFTPLGQWLDRVVDEIGALRAALTTAGDAHGTRAPREAAADWLAAADRTRASWRAAPVDPRGRPPVAFDAVEHVNPLTQLLFGRRKRPR